MAGFWPVALSAGAEQSGEESGKAKEACRYYGCQYAWYFGGIKGSRNREFVEAISIDNEE
ncbi:MAG: hypothetical protein AB1483_04550 [Candidatus Zixiibacteriota bacterium]